MGGAGEVESLEGRGMMSIEGISDLEIQLQLRINQVGELRDRINELNEDLESKRKELKRRWTRIEELSKEISNLKAQLSLSSYRQNEISGLQTILSEKDNRIKELEEALIFYSDKSNLEKYVWQKTKHNSQGSWDETGLMTGITKVAENAINHDKNINKE